MGENVMSETYKRAEKDYVKGMKYKDIAEKYNVSLNTVKSWKQRYGWNRKKDAHKEKSMHTKKGVEIESLQSDDLTDKQRLFCMYYLKYFNATKAYQKAYECTYQTANVNGSRLLVKASVNQEIDRMKAEQAKGLKLDAQFILQKYIDIAFADITDFATFGKKEVQAMGAFGPVEDDDGNPVMVEVNYVDFKESSEIDGSIITEVKKGKDGVSVKLADKMKAFDKLWEYFEVMPKNIQDQLKSEKLKAETELVKARAEAIKGTKKDTTLLEALIAARKGSGTE